ncbi:DUF2586 domain-containing protein [Thalassotalea sp. 1_MG-2023]|uniref:DUF2586 domain-containing protein n=1 Tax=Thalassotalea sp. 1_MG-2023 TaxID=3062680 RepID=UPI0026E125E9|nr:DUF2586 domain-containing protein [Thalassotalea sp. 1_MG-2023]MDO6426234.1 DUF2586 domain-containing protein [Thalassotalea sp. 1_MG-2023]
MAQGKVSVTSANTGSGATKEVERSVLFIGEGTENLNTVVAINAQSDFDTLISDTDSPLKTQLQAWVRNGDDLVTGWAIPITNGDNIMAEIDKAMDQDVSPEIIVVSTPVTGKADVEAYQAKMQTILAAHARRIRILLAAPGCDPDPATGETWAEHNTAIQPLIDGVVADRTAVIPLLYGDELGAVTGRLCKRSVTIADSPMRTQTGSLSLLPSPVDKTGAPLTNAVTAALDALRFSCVQFYPDFDGIYFGDVNMLDAEGGDYQKIEAGRVVDKAARQVRIIAIWQIKNRRLNNSSSGIAFGKRVLSKPLRDMAKSINLGADKFPGEIQEPKEDAIGLTFTSPTELHVLLKVKPIDSPSTILVGIMLDNAQ